MRKIKNIGTWIVSLSTLFISKTAFAATCFKSVFNDTCYTTYEQWLNDVWKWALTILVPLSVLIITAAGVIYMTSGGNPDRVKMAKKMIWGVLSGVGLIILARVLLVNVIGVGAGWNIN